jgi:hypothetical protein
MTAWSMSETDVDCFWMGSTSSSKRAGRVARTSRRVAVSGGSLTLRHVPTGVTVQGEIPEGHYSRREFAAERERLQTTLWQELEDRVARDPRLKRRRGRSASTPGRSPGSP